MLCLLPAGDGASADRLRRLWRGKSVAPAGRATRRYGWARYALWATLAIPYVMAGLSKLRNAGFQWWDATNFKYILFYSTLRPMEFDFEWALLFTSAPDTLVEALAVAALLGELCYGLVLVSRRARWAVPLLTLGMHLGILFLQNILFFDLILLQLLFFNFRPLLRAAGRRLRERAGGPLRLTYDAAAGRPTRAARVLQALDVFGRFDVQGGAPQAAAWTVARGGGDGGDGRVLTETAARWRCVARAVPALWPLVPLLYVPLAGLAVARGAERLAVGGEAAAPAKEAAPRREAGRPASWVATPRLTLAVAALLFVCWTLRLEVYPLTGMQMFSKVNGPVVTYEIPKAHLRSGEVVEAPIREAIGAMADSRYRRLLEGVFEPEKEDLSRRFLGTFAARWNRQARPERRITQVVVEQWRWDYEEAPEHPDHGEVVARKVYPVAAPLR